MSDGKQMDAVPVDPVAAARAKLAAEDGAGQDTIAALRKQVRGLWVMSGVTLVLLIALAAFSLLPRLLGVRAFGGPDFQGRPGQFQQMQQNGQQGTGAQTQP